MDGRIKHLDSERKRMDKKLDAERGLGQRIRTITNLSKKWVSTPSSSIFWLMRQVL